MFDSLNVTHPLAFVSCCLHGIFFFLRPKADLRFSWQLGLHLEGTPSRCGSPSHGSDVACCCCLVPWVSCGIFFVSFFHQSWSHRTYPVLHPVICCDGWLAKTSRFFFGGGEASPLGGCWTGGIAAGSSKIHWFFEDSRPLKGPFVLLKGAMKPKCWNFQVSFFCLGMVESNDQRSQHPWSKVNFGRPSWILPPVAGDGGGGCTKECQKTPRRNSVS